MRTGRPIPPLSITEDQRGALENSVRCPKDSASIGTEGTHHLACAGGQAEQVVAQQVRVRQQTVSKWRSRFLSKGLEGLLDKSRPGTPRKVSDTDVEKVLTMALVSQPRDATHWSTRSMAGQCGLSRRPLAGFGGLSPFSHIAAKPSNFPRTHCSSTKSETLWVYI